MSDTPSAEEWREHFQDGIEFYRGEVERLERLLTECYNSGGLSPDLMRRVGKALGREG